jgi:hypothetical protein
MLFLIDREAPMWIVEVNFAGRRFTHEVHGPRRPLLGFRARSLGWRPSPVRDPRVA